MLYYDDIAVHSLNLECTSDDLSEAQLAYYKKAEDECADVQNKLKEAIQTSGGQNVFAGEVFSAYHFMGPTPEIEKISKPLSEFKKTPKPATQKTSKRDTNAATSSRIMRDLTIEKVSNIYNDDDDEDYIPLSKRIKAKEAAKKTVSHVKSTSTISRIRPSDKSPQSSVRPTEASSIGGLVVGAEVKTKSKVVIDLTKEDPRLSSDSKEISFNKLQGKTYPSLVVVARPSLKVKENTIADRQALDAKVKEILMSTPTKFAEWLIKQGLVRSDQICQVHPGTKLKLGMYSDATKFPFSGGYVWISDCCPTRFVSVFNGSIFEGSSHAPSLILKLIYHWSCQTNIQNVIQWVSVDNLYVKSLYSWLRSVCTVALHQHMTMLGGDNKKIEVGVISLGTTTQDGQQRQVKVEVLGILDPESKLVRLRAVEPLTDGERNYKKRFSKILEPLPGWVHKDSIILTDLTVDKGTLNSMGYRAVFQTIPTDNNKQHSNANIMDYLRRIVPRMFQNTLSLLSRQIIQQFLDELVWREWYGCSPGLAFDSIISHTADQTRLETREPLVSRLNKVAANPFKNWSHLSVRLDAFNKRTKGKRSETITAPMAVIPRMVQSPKHSPVQKLPVRTTPVPSKTSNTKGVVKKATMAKEEPKLETVNLENFYYGVYDENKLKLNAMEVEFKVKCPQCPVVLYKNTDLQDHIYLHLTESRGSEENQLCCRYCMVSKTTDKSLEKHILHSHPLTTKNNSSSSVNCLICDTRMSAPNILISHMHLKHTECELPYRCPCCSYRSSSHHLTIDHFYENHNNSGAMLCPFCLKVYNVFHDNETNKENVQSYMLHLKEHLNSRPVNRQCSRCALTFLNEGHKRVHAKFYHQTFNKKVKAMTAPTTTMIKPKQKNNYQKEAPVYKIIRNIKDITIVAQNGKMCLECDLDFEDDTHISHLMMCTKCSFQTYCLPTMFEHSTYCANVHFNQMQMDAEMYCVCGFSSNLGNIMARHLVLCQMSTAYPSCETALDNTVKRNMLNVLGLIRREDETTAHDDSSQDQEPSTSGTPTDKLSRISDLDPSAISTTMAINSPVAAQDKKQSDEETAETHAQSQTHFDQPSIENDSTFNTQLSLDDLGPPSVLPSVIQSENDRTPQLKEEYQSLATPLVLMQEQETVEYDSTITEEFV